MVDNNHSVDKSVYQLHETTTRQQTSIETIQTTLATRGAMLQTRQAQLAEIQTTLHSHSAALQHITQTVAEISAKISQKFPSPLYAADGYNVPPAPLSFIVAGSATTAPPSAGSPASPPYFVAAATPLLSSSLNTPSQNITSLTPSSPNSYTETLPSIPCPLPTNITTSASPVPTTTMSTNNTTAAAPSTDGKLFKSHLIQPQVSAEIYSSTTLTTPYQIINKSGFANSTNLRASKVTFASSALNSKLMFDCTKISRSDSDNYIKFIVGIPDTSIPSKTIFSVSNTNNQPDLPQFAFFLNTHDTWQHVLGKIRDIDIDIANAISLSRSNFPILNSIDILDVFRSTNISRVFKKVSGNVDAEILTWWGNFAAAQYNTKMDCRILIIDDKMDSMLSSVHSLLQPIIYPIAESPIKNIFSSIQKLLLTEQFIKLLYDCVTPIATTVYIRKKLQYESRILVFDPGGASNLLDLEDKVDFEGQAMIWQQLHCSQGPRCTFHLLTKCMN